MFEVKIVLNFNIILSNHVNKYNVKIKISLLAPEAKMKNWFVYKNVQCKKHLITRLTGLNTGFTA